MSYSVFVPVLNGGDKFVALSEVLSRQSGMGEGHVFVDSGSSDGSLDIATAVDGFATKSIDTSSFDHGGTRNLARQLCSGDIVVYLTQDATPLSEGDIGRLLHAFEDADVAAAYGRQLPYGDASLFGAHLRRFNYSDSSHQRCYEDRQRYGLKTAFLSNSFAAYRRSAMDEIGWFKDSLILGEDAYAGAKLLAAGYKLAYVAEAEVYHSHNYSVWQEFQRYFDIGVFHCLESWLPEEFGKPEGEGMRYLRSELAYISRSRAYYLFPEFLVRNTMKYTGYLLGRHFKRLPKILLRKLSMHRRWWDKYFTA